MCFREMASDTLSTDCAHSDRATQLRCEDRNTLYHRALLLVSIQSSVKAAITLYREYTCIRPYYMKQFMQKSKSNRQSIHAYNPTATRVAVVWSGLSK